ncbi:MAG TPA: hypothetical protein DHW82_03895 [Spirochaetia bacterium]|nr:MAG: hypothetical protein A2Y41_02520 [Spirochaetes bacterium GWB1_36_13]HCL56136.1 hypothetical protein [Spirochaetia bacterium]
MKKKPVKKNPVKEKLSFFTKKTIFFKIEDDLISCSEGVFLITDIEEKKNVKRSKIFKIFTR